MYCTKCGAVLDETAAFCSACGQSTPGRPPAVAIAPMGANVPAVTTTSSPSLYAGFWLRLAAYLIDGLLIGVVFLIVFGLLAVVSGLGAALSSIQAGQDPGALIGLLGMTSVVAILGIGLVGVWLYYALMESSSWQGTLGKKALGLAVTDMSGLRVSFGRASGRHFAKFITSLIPLAVGYILAGFTEKKQAIHDMIAGCLVLRRA